MKRSLYTALALVIAGSGIFAACSDSDTSTTGATETSADATTSSTSDASTTTASTGATTSTHATSTSTSTSGGGGGGAGGQGGAGGGGGGGGGTGGTGGAGGAGGAPHNVCDDAPGATINGCVVADVVDMTGPNPVVIDFGGDVGFVYQLDAVTPATQACVKVSIGQQVTFTGAGTGSTQPKFNGHPLTPGEVRDGMLCPAGATPKDSLAETSHTFTFDAAGSYPFYCGFHGTLGMAGLIVVE